MSGKQVILFVAFALIAGTVACSSSSEPDATATSGTGIVAITPTPETSPTPTLSPTPTPSPTPALSPTPTPSPTPAPLPLPTPLPAPTLLPLRSSGVAGETVETICLEVTQSGDTTSQAIDTAIEQTLSRAGIDVVTSGCDATLSVAMTFRAVGAQYASAALSCYDYSGAINQGQITLTASGHAPVVIPVDAEQGTPETIGSCSHPTPGSAPFANVWHGEVMDALSKLWGYPILVHALGSDILDMTAFNRLQTIRSDRAREAAGEIVPALIRVLDDDDPDVRRYAVKALGRFTPEALAATPILIQLLTDPDEEVRKSASETLGRFGPEAAPAVPALLELVDDENWLTADAAIQALGGIGPGAVEAVPTLIEILEGNDLLLKPSAAEALGNIGPEAEEAVPALIQALDDERLGNAAARALGKIGPEAAQEALPALIHVLEDPGGDWEAQRYAPQLLGAMGPAAAGAVPALTRIVEEGVYEWDRHVVEAAARALGMIGPAAEAAIPTLTVQMQDEDDPRLAAISAVALARIGAMDMDEAIRFLIEMLESEKDVAAIELGLLGPQAAEAIPALIQSLDDAINDGDTMQALTAMGALGGIGPQTEDVIPTLIEVMTRQGKSDFNDTLRAYAIYALGDIGPEAMEAVPVLIDVLGDEQAAAEALAAITGQDFGDDINAWQAWWDSQ